MAETRGLPVLTPEATWISLGRELAVHDLTAVADRLISGTLRDPALSSRERLEAALHLHASRANGRLLRRALADARQPVWSRPETLLRLLIAAARLPEPVPNYDVTVIGGNAVVDLAWPELRISIEYDGRWHDRTPERWAADAVRRERLIDAGWTTVHVRADELFGSPHTVISRLVRRRVSAGAPLAPSIDLTQLPHFGR